MTERRVNLTDLPEVVAEPRSADLLSHVLGQIRLEGDRVFTRALDTGDRIDLSGDVSHVCVVASGGVQVGWTDGERVGVDAGGLVLLTRGGGPGLVALAGGASVVVGRFSIDPDSLQGIAFSLPRYIRLSSDEGQGWLEPLVHFLLIEAEDDEPGANLMVSRLIDLAVVRTLRTWVHRRDTPGWLGGLADPRIARALKALHDDPAKPWSIAGMAAAAGMSRSNFCDQFTALVGRAPLRYRNDVRLALAHDLLAVAGARVGEVGARVGYDSEAAFSRAYKAQYGRPPSADTRARQPSTF
jgi:AraC-like DNA-binding protein